MSVITVAVAGQSNAMRASADVVWLGHHAVLTPTSGRSQVNPRTLNLGPTVGLIAQGASLDQTVRVIHHAVNGSSIASWLSTHQAAHTAITVDCRAWIPDWLLWVQGEAEADSEAAAHAYQANLETLIANYRTAWGSGLKVVLARNREPAPGSHAYTGVVNAAKDAVAAADPLVASLNTNHLGVIPDGLHYNTASELLLGRDAWSAWRNL